MRQAQNLEEIHALVENPEKVVFFFSADWCGDCRFIKPSLDEIELQNKDFTFILVDRDQFIDLAKTWDIYGIPSLLVTQSGKEVGRFVNRNRKTKEEINNFLKELN